MNQRALERWKQDLYSDTSAKLRPSVKILNSLPFTVQFHERAQIFRMWIQAEKQSHPVPYREFIPIRRNYLIEDGLAAVSDGKFFKGAFRVKLIDQEGRMEEGVDMGGVFKEFMELLVKSIFDEKYGLFCKTTTGHYFPNPHVQQLSVHDKVMELVGRVVGLAVFEGILLDVRFAHFFLRVLIGQSVVCKLFLLLKPLLKVNQSLI
jgi:ubiquitin-protein ligase E3 C